ncbi:MAG: hypothetical protein WBH85_15050 [Thermoanaerobaculia bacterium]
MAQVALASAMVLVSAGVEATDSVAALRAEMESLRIDYEQRIADLEKRLAELESQQPDKVEADVDAIRAAARDAAATGVQVTPPPTEGPVVGKERNLSLLNPEISATGIFLADKVGGESGEFTIDEVELDIQAALDPFSRMRLTFAYEGEGVEIEEGYVVYGSLPGAMAIMAGKFRQRFGTLNRQHLHALPQSEYPLAIQTYFGEEGLAQTGLSFSWLLPKLWATANEIDLEITDGENEEAFGGETFEDFSYLGRFNNFWDIGATSYVEWGLSGIMGKTADDGDSAVWGTNFTYSWSPPGRALYRGINWRTELFLSQRDDELGEQHDAWGGFTYLEGLLTRNLWAGVRLDRAEQPLQPDLYRWGVLPYLTWWQSEYVRLRGEYGYLVNEPTGESENRFTLQLTWAAGPHKHAIY